MSQLQEALTCVCPAPRSRRLALLDHRFWQDNKRLDSVTSPARHIGEANLAVSFDRGL